MITPARLLGLVALAAAAFAGPGEPKADDLLEPASDPEVTIWARAGARSFVTCASEDEAATLAAARWQGRAQELPDAHQWAQRAADCPHAPQVARLAALHELSRIFVVPPRVDEVDLTPLAEQIEASRRKAIAWIDDSLAEQARRGERPTRLTRYYLAQGYLSLGESKPALEILEAAEQAGEVEPWRAAYLAALAHLVGGDLPRALQESHRAVLHARGKQELSAQYVYALVLDRAGEPSTAEALLRNVRARDRDSAELMALLVALPLHERIYLQALDRQANASVPNEALRLWAAYLQLEAPSPAERALAERHRAQLIPLPGKI